MGKGTLKSIGLGLVSNRVTLAAAAYGAAWLLTFSIGKLFWGKSLPNGSPSVFVSSWLIPLVIVMGVAYWSMRRKDVFRLVEFSFAALLVLVIVNIILFQHPFNNYGDHAQLNQYLSLNSGFRRWMLGSSVLNLVYHSLWVPLITHHLLPEIFDLDVFIRLSSGLSMGVFSILLIHRYPNRLSIILPLSTPIWMLLSSGYNEYYPFIAPFLLLILVFLTQSDLKNISPFWMGLLLAALGLAYAGFVPICALVLFIYFLRLGFKKALLALVLAGAFTILLIVLLWPYTSLPSFLKYYVIDLNLGQGNIYYSAYEGKALPFTPFFSLGYVVALSHLKDVFFMSFWGGGLLSIPVIATGGIVLLKKGWLILKEPG